MQEALNPADGSVYVRRPLTTDAEIDAALDGAMAARREWRCVASGNRVDVPAKG